MASETEKDDIAGTTEPEFALITVKTPVDDGLSPLKADWAEDVVIDKVTTAFGFDDPSDSDVKVRVTPVFQFSGLIVTLIGDAYAVPETPLPDAVNKVLCVAV